MREQVGFDEFYLRMQKPEFGYDLNVSDGSPKLVAPPKPPLAVERGGTSLALDHLVPLRSVRAVGGERMGLELRPDFVTPS